MGKQFQAGLVCFVDMNSTAHAV